MITKKGECFKHSILLFYTVKKFFYLKNDLKLIIGLIAESFLISFLPLNRKLKGIKKLLSRCFHCNYV